MAPTQTVQVGSGNGWNHGIPFLQLKGFREDSGFPDLGEGVERSDVTNIYILGLVGCC